LTDQYFKAPVLAMLFVGNDTGCFSALAMNSVGKAAMDMVYEVRRQSGKFWNYGRNCRNMQNV
jgi:Na+/H+-translocating membrane pyrophosphatase